MAVLGYASLMFWWRRRRDVGGKSTNADGGEDRT
jgi:hypothetical protein